MSTNGSHSDVTAITEPIFFKKFLAPDKTDKSGIILFNIKMLFELLKVKTQPSIGPEGIFPSGNRFLRRRHVVGNLKHRIQACQFKDPDHWIAGRGEEEILALLARLLKPFEKTG